MVPNIYPKTANTYFKGRLTFDVELKITLELFWQNLPNYILYKVYRSHSKLKIVFLKALRKKKPSIKKFKKLPFEKLQKCSTLNLTFLKNMEKIIHIQGSISVYFDVCIVLINILCTPHLYRKFVFRWVSIDKFLPSCLSWEITIL